ncbi:MAG: RsmE family RNA methyltransferase [Myxococcota bacterium]
MAEPRRLFAPSLPAAGGEVRLPPDAAHHARVVRLAPGDAVFLFDGRGYGARGHVERMDGEAVVCRVQGAREVDPVPGEAVLVLATPKAGKLDGIVRMATEAGVAAVRLVATERTVGRPEPKRAEARMERLRRVAREAARQAGRADVPELEAPGALEAVVARAPADALRLMADPGAAGSIAEAVTDRTRPVWIAVGPEGGFSAAERAWLAAQGFAGVRLGPHVLRVETAAPVAVALVMDRLGAERGPARHDRTR